MAEATKELTYICAAHNITNYTHFDWQSNNTQILGCMKMLLAPDRTGDRFNPLALLQLDTSAKLVHLRTTLLSAM